MTVTKYDGIKFMDVAVSEHVATVTVNAPPINIITPEHWVEFVKLANLLRDDDDVRVVVIQSDIPGYFMPHYSVTALAQWAGGPGPSAALTLEDTGTPASEILRTMGKVTIAIIEGRAGGGGAEIAYGCDMRFGTIGKTIFCQPEVAIGIAPGAGACARLARLVGRSRAMEICLGCMDIDASTAEKWGILNRALPLGEVRPFVHKLAKRIATFPVPAVQATKLSVNRADMGTDIVSDIIFDQNAFRKTMATKEAKTAMDAFLAAGGDTDKLESRIGDACEELGQKLRL
ncbi:ClpP/crotonase [Gonapodya prolifera JEL478]|uniref:ClpP/crotonase n=1 Tax=Gonapodya prolifera (strain JEL478) TaxID=1344416 RepID=A0A139AKP5_GONPJ|nr:ClpP/crotonase [Gonapodya prolifera JEL478]|eukprot:KXS17073.1 ClpP/crotonase [Gonapodya prolifera JEL478]